MSGLLSMPLLSEGAGGETASGRGQTPRGQTAAATDSKANKTIRDVIADLKNAELKKNVEDKLVKCLKEIVQARGNNPSVDENFILNNCKMAHMGDCRPNNASYGAKNSCHKDQNGCRALDMGRIECGDFKLVPSSEPDGNEHYFTLAKCLSGDKDFLGNGAGGSSSEAQAATAGGVTVGVCYHDPKIQGENTVGKCDKNTHCNHIHFSAGSCGANENLPPHNHPPGSCKGGKNNAKPAT